MGNSLNIYCHTLFAYIACVCFYPKGKCTVTKFYDTHNIFYVGEMLQAKTPLSPSYHRCKHAQRKRKRKSMWGETVIFESILCSMKVAKRINRKKHSCSFWNVHSNTILHDCETGYVLVIDFLSQFATLFWIHVHSSVCTAINITIFIVFSITHMVRCCCCSSSCVRVVIF